MYKNFVSDCLEGAISADEIDNYVEYWHTHETNTTLCEFLGMTDEEYHAWLTRGKDALNDILCHRRNAINGNKSDT